MPVHSDEFMSNDAALEMAVARYAENGMPPHKIAKSLKLTPDHVARIMGLFDVRYRAYCEKARALPLRRRS